MKLYLIIALSLCLSLFAEDAFSPIEDKRVLPLLNPSLKEQKTLKIELKNGLQAIIISDPSAKQSLATLTVLAGSWQEPDQMPGLAHFLEHMLFLGTSQYPEESEFGHYLAEHGGETNAFTHGDYTSYMFYVNTSGFSEALDRFASFFKEPLFNPSGVGRELNAIDQEFAQGFNNEPTREYHVIKSLLNPKHPAHRFQTGNSKTLANATHDDLQNWFNAHYSANLMRLYVLSPLPIEELQGLVVRDFSTIPNKKLKPFSSDESLFTDDLKGHELFIETKKNLQTLSLIWEIPKEIVAHLAEKPEALVCFVLGHEGGQSLLAELKREGMAEELSCGPIDLGAKTLLFEIEVKLTTKGLESIDTVIDRVFQSIHFMQQNPFPKEVFDEYSLMLKHQYQYQQRDEPLEWASKQGSYLAREPIATFPELSLTIQHFDRNLIEALLKTFSPENCVIIVSAPAAKQKLDLTQKEAWMNIAYAIQPLSPSKIAQWKASSLHPAIGYPALNPWLAHAINAPILAKEGAREFPLIKAPEKITPSAGTLCYYSQDAIYQVPRTYIRLQIQSPEIKDGKPQAVVQTELYIKALEDQLGEMIYAAKMADMTFKIERTYGAIQISLEGFTESVTAFFPELVKLLQLPPLKSDKFAIYKNALLREYQNFDNEMPVTQAIDFFKSGVFEKYSTYLQKEKAIKKVDEDLFQRFSEKLLKKTYLKAIFTGSLSKEQALKLAQFLDQSLHPEGSQIASAYYPRVIDLPKTHGPFLLSSKTPAQGNALLLALETEFYTPQVRNCQQLLSLAMSEAYFSELRTKQQTSYIITSDAVDLQRHLFTYFALQSNTHSPNELLWRSEQFIELYLRDLSAVEIPEQRFANLKTALLTKLSEPPQNLQLFGELLFKLGFEVEDYSWLKKRIELLEQLNYDEFVKFAKTFLGRSNKRRLAVMIKGTIPETHEFEYFPIKNLSALRDLKK